MVDNWISDVNRRIQGAQDPQVPGSILLFDTGTLTERLLDTHLHLVTAMSQPWIFMRQCGPNRPPTSETRTRAYRLRVRSPYTNQRGSRVDSPQPYCQHRYTPLGTGDMISARYPSTAVTEAFKTMSCPDFLFLSPAPLVS